MHVGSETDSAQGSSEVRPRRKKHHRRPQRRYSKRKVGQLAFLAFMMVLSVVVGYLASRFM